MKRIVFLIAMVCMAWVGARAQDSQLVRTEFEGKGITGLAVSSAWDVTVRQGKETGARIEFPERFEKNIVFSLGADGVLRIGLKRKIKGYHKGEVFKAEVVCNSLEQVKLSGACDLKGEGDFRDVAVQRAYVDLSGAAGIRLHTTELISGKASGASSLKYAGSPVVEVKVSGAADLRRL